MWLCSFFICVRVCGGAEKWDQLTSFYQGSEGGLSGQENKCEDLSLVHPNFAMTHCFSFASYTFPILFSMFGLLQQPDKTERYFFIEEPQHLTDAHSFAGQSFQIFYCAIHHFVLFCS